MSSVNLQKIAQMNFLRGVSADWIVPPVVIVCIACLFYFVAH